MNAIRSALLLIVLLAAAACAPLPGASRAGAASGAVSGPAQSAAAPALSATPGYEIAAPAAADLPTFPGLYWTPDLLVSANDEAARIVALLPCAELFDVLAAGEWRLAARAEAPAELAAFVASLALLEWGEAAAWVEAAEGLLATEQPDDAGAAPGAYYCQARLSVLSDQPVEAQGVENARGTARQYPVMGGCQDLGDGRVQVALRYEGPGDFRATLRFAAPAAAGRHTVEAESLEVTLGRSDTRLIDALAEAFASAAGGGEDEDEDDGMLGGRGVREYFPETRNAGTLIIHGTAPLSGEISLPNLLDEYDEQPQTFSAGFRCTLEP